MVIIKSTKQSVRVGFLDPLATPVAEISSGEVVSYPNTWTHWGNGATYGMSFEDREPLRHQYPDGPFSLIGPLNVKEAQIGDTLEVNIKRIKPISWGWNSSPVGVGALPKLLNTSYLHYFKFDRDRKHASFVKDITITLRPFVGYIAAEPISKEKISANLAGDYGGNIDFPELIEGASIFLPVSQPGGRIWIGNINGGQADGVVDQTGIETAAEELEIVVTRRTTQLSFPVIETETDWVIVGYAQDSLDQALQNALLQVIKLLNESAGMTFEDAYALSSMAVDFSITQYADQLSSVYQTTPPKAVHARIPKSVFGTETLGRINKFLRGVEDGPNQ